MEIKTKVFKRKSGASKGKWTTRVEFYNDVAAKSQTIERLFATRARAIENRERLVAEVKKSHGQIRTGERMTFSDLAEVFRQRFYKEAVVVEGKKIEGVRALNTAENHLKVLTEYFGKKRLGQITVETLKNYRSWRRRIGSRHPAAIASGTVVDVKLATINRELSAMGRMMRYAYSQGWVTRDIFFKAGVIDVSVEMERTRLLTDSEETRLLAACSGSREVPYTRVRHGKKETILSHVEVHNPHLKALVLLALDAGLRRGEMLKLRWSDIDLEANLITIIGTHTKTERPRLVPLTERAKAELVRLRVKYDNAAPFPMSEFKRSWGTAKRLAGIEDLHFHDLRRTAITRWILDGNPIALAGKVAGHTQLQTTMKHYTSIDVDIIRGFTEKMNAKHAS